MKSEEFLSPERESVACNVTAVEYKSKSKTMRRIGMLLCAALFILHSSLFVSCSEADDTIDEYANWQEKNDIYFEQQYQGHSLKYPGWMEASSKTIDQLPHTACILVEKLGSGIETTSPCYTDSVLVHYSGRLIPSPSYADGYEFDRSYLPPFDPEVDVPAAFALNSLTPGFSTAVQHMHRGDYWRVIVPYELGYNKEVKTSIPAYSTLIFDIWLVDFWSKERGDRDE